MYFVSDPTVFGFRFQIWDVLILFIVIAFINMLFLKKRGFSGYYKVPIPKITYYLLTFLVLLFIEGMIDFGRNHTPISDIIKTARPWLTVLILPLIPFYLSKDDMSWIIKALAVFTGICLIIVPLQGALPFELPGAARNDGLGGTRYGMMPYFWFLYLWFVVFNPKIELKHKILLAALLFISMVFTQARKNFLAVIVTTAFFYMKDFKIKRVPAIIAGVFLVLVWYFNFAPPRIRLLHEEVGGLLSNNLSSYYMGTANTTEERLLYGENNIQYRAFHFIERFNFLKKDPIKLVFGFSMIHDSHFKKRIFVINEGDKQLDTGDISWSYLIVRYGLFGIALVILYNLVFIGSFNRYYESCYSKMGIAYILTILTLSIGDAYVIFPNVYVVPYLLLLIARNELHPSKIDIVRRPY